MPAKDDEKGRKTGRLAPGGTAGLGWGQGGAVWWILRGADSRAGGDTHAVKFRPCSR